MSINPITDTTESTVDPTTDASVAVDAPVVELSKPIPSTDFQTLIANMRSTGTQAQKILIASLDRYVTDMQPGRVVKDSEGARSQYNLWKAITYIAETAPVDEFKRLWNILLAYSEEYKDGVFQDRYIFRFSEYWIWSEHELNGLHRILNIIKLTSNTATRADGLRQVSLDRSLMEGFTDDARQRIIMFYKG